MGHYDKWAYLYAWMLGEPYYGREDKWLARVSPGNGQEALGLASEVLGAILCPHRGHNLQLLNDLAYTNIDRLLHAYLSDPDKPWTIATISTIVATPEVDNHALCLSRERPAWTEERGYQFCVPIMLMRYSVQTESPAPEDWNPYLTKWTCTEDVVGDYAEAQPLFVGGTYASLLCGLYEHFLHLTRHFRTLDGVTVSNSLLATNWACLLKGEHPGNLGCGPSLAEQCSAGTCDKHYGYEPEAAADCAMSIQLHLLDTVPPEDTNFFDVWNVALADSGQSHLRGRS